MALISMLLPYFNRKEYLKVSLDSFQYFYKDNDIEFIIVDDGSAKQHAIDNLVSEYSNLNIRLIRIENKTGTNPSRPYNVAARNATGKILLLSSPEITHTSSIIETLNVMGEMAKDDYFIFSVFCPTEPDFTARMLKEELFVDKLEYIKSSQWKIHDPPTTGAFSNKFGSWYLHSKHRPTHLNFLTAISTEKYYELCGFDERFVGTGYDDNEFLDRVIPGANIRYCDEFEAIHINHPPVYGSDNPISNQNLYHSIKSGKIDKWNNVKWGL